MNNLIIVYHAKNDKTGWNEVCRHPLDSIQWTPQHKVFIDEMINQGEWVLTIGWNMYQIIRG